VLPRRKAFERDTHGCNIRPKKSEFHGVFPPKFALVASETVLKANFASELRQRSCLPKGRDCDLSKGIILDSSSWEPTPCFQEIGFQGC